MLKLPFKGTYIRTQDFNDPCCRGMYTKFGLCGHNGWDFGTPTGTELFSPHDGKVTESRYDSSYGNYVKIENPTEASVIGHMKTLPKVKVGDIVSQGQLIGLSGNTGNSTGAHVHWGYIRNPRNKNNGFNGYTDQIYFMEDSKELQDMRDSRDAWKESSKDFEEKLKISNNLLSVRDKTIETLQGVIATNKTPVSEYSASELFFGWLSKLGIRVPKVGDNQ